MKRNYSFHPWKQYVNANNCMCNEYNASENSKFSDIDKLVMLYDSYQ